MASTVNKKFIISEPSVSQLAHVLTEEIQLYQKYADYLRGDSERMIQLKTEELEDSNKAKATILLKIQALEQARQKIVKKIAEEKSIAEEKVKISDICQTISKSDGAELFRLRDQLQTVIHEIKQMQDEASYLVRSSLTWIDGSMANLKRILTPSGVYNARGRVGGASTFAGHVVENKA